MGVEAYTADIRSHSLSALLLGPASGIRHQQAPTATTACGSLTDSPATGWGWLVNWGQPQLEWQLRREAVVVRVDGDGSGWLNTGTYTYRLDWRGGTGAV
jgi:hypothetical protein